MCWNFVDTSKPAAPSSDYQRCVTKRARAARVLVLTGFLLLSHLIVEQSAAARRCHRVKSANGRVYCTIYRLRDADIPFAAYLLTPTAVRLDLERLAAGMDGPSREDALRYKLFRDTTNEFTVSVDDIVELSSILQQEDQTEDVFRCTDLLLNLAQDTESGVNVTALKETAQESAVAACQRKIDQADTFVHDNDYSSALATLDSIVRLKDTGSPAAARLDWKVVVTKLVALRPHVRPIQQVLIDHEIFKANYVERLVPLSPEMRSLFTQNVSPKDTNQPAQVPQ